MRGRRALAALALVVAVGVGVDLFAGAPVPGYGAGLGAGGVVVLTIVADVVGRWLRRDAGYYDHVDTPAPSTRSGTPDVPGGLEGGRG